MNIKLTKISDSDLPTGINRIEAGHIVVGRFVRKPKVGECFLVGYLWSTSIVKEIINNTTFRTMNSIYKWKPLCKELPW